MKTVGDYVDLKATDAREQWARILSRSVRQRQEKFLPIEVILSYALFFIVVPNRFGGANIEKAPKPVHALAKLFKRTPGSILSKMLNLEGSRTNCARLEPELYLRFSDDSAGFKGLYLLVIHAAREVGIGEAQLPEFLDLESTDIMLLGQDEIGGREVEVAMVESAADRDRLKERFNLEEQETERLVERKVRQRQAVFARSVLENFQWTCGFCRFNPTSLRRYGLLRASHIKPWSVCNSRERLDVDNGIAACPTHDSAFDRGLITVNGGLNVHRSRALDASVARDRGVDAYFGSSVLLPQLWLPEGGVAPNQRYLDYHRTEIFKNESAPLGY